MIDRRGYLVNAETEKARAMADLTGNHTLSIKSLPSRSQSLYSAVGGLITLNGYP